jgi:uncharacterized protein (AIM24 family)
MQIEILAQPANTVAKITFEAGEEITAEGGSMVAMSAGLSIETSTHKRGKGGIGRAIKRAFAGESFFLNHYQKFIVFRGHVLAKNERSGQGPNQYIWRDLPC